ncbi:hypothetical protein LguiB_033720 [Lonicera macranthoides]
MSMLTKLRCITLDVTGTLIAYKGELGDYYCMAAKSVGLPCPDYKRMHEGFKLAYTDMAKKHPCFGHADKMPNIVWWKTCVRDSFVKVECAASPIAFLFICNLKALFGLGRGESEILFNVGVCSLWHCLWQAGYDYDEETFEKVFRRIYSTFGSAAPYTLFADSQPFLRWARKKGLIVGLVSNAEYRYQDVILPALGLNQGSEWDFGVFSGLEGVEKPDPKIYEIALERAGNIAPEEALHIGDSMRKDYVPATSVGMHGLLLDRFKTPDAEDWKKSGATVLPDLVAAQEWLVNN